jgi:DNA-binding MarR family transcriptional regulator
MSDPADTLLAYLAVLTGERPDLTKVSQQKLPLYLRKRYTCNRARILGRDWILAIQNTPEDKTSASTYAAQAELLTNHLGMPTVLVLPALQTRARQKLVQLGVPFIVPGRQTFLPLALVDLRERQDRRHRRNGQRLTPTAQVVLLYHLHRQNLDGWPLRRIAKAVGYSPIMLSKVRAELEATKLCRSRKKGRAISLVFALEGRELWEAALPWLSNPVRTVHGARCNMVPAGAVVAGMTALSRVTKLSDDRIPTICMNAAALRAAIDRGTLRITPDDEEADVKVEAWSYDPCVLTELGTADPLSVYLTLRESPDERIQEQLEALIQEISWS